MRYALQISQGNAQIEYTILSWLSAKGYLKYEDIRNIPDEKVLPYITPPKSHLHVETQYISEEYEFTKGYIDKTLIPNRDRGDEREEGFLALAERSILSGMIDQDNKFQEEERELRRKNSDPSLEIEPDSLYDPHASYVRKYLVSGAPIVETESSPIRPIYDELFKGLRTRLYTLVPRLSEPPVSKDSIDEYYEYDNLMLRDLRKLEGKWKVNHSNLEFFKSNQVL